MIKNLPTLPGVTIFFDESGAMPQLVITAQKNIKLPNAFISACHDFAGNNGATIEFVQ